MAWTRSRSPHEHGIIARVVRRAASASARRPWTTIVLWLVLVVGCLAAGTMTGTKQLTDAQSGTGESARAEKRIEAAGLRDPAVESILVRSSDPAATAKAANDLEARARKLPEVASVQGPNEAPALSTAGGRTVLVQARLRGDPDDAADHVGPLEDTVAAVRREHRGVSLMQAGDGSGEKAFDDVLKDDLQRAELFSVPVTLVVLVLAFGALVAASVPLLLGVTSVAAALGAFGVVSQVAPDGGSTSSLVVLIGLAVGVDYSLFYIRREREERRAGLGPDAALRATAATVGRAVLVSGLTVMVALAGLLVTGLAVFTSMALATIIVVAIAVLGSITVLPAVLAKLGDRVDRGRIPFLRRRGRRRGPWAAFARRVTRRPLAALVISVSLLGTLAVPALDMHTAAVGDAGLPRDLPTVEAKRAIERSFPGAPADAQLVVTGQDLDGKRRQLEALGQKALHVTGGRGQIDIEVARDGRTALVAVPMPDRGPEAARETVDALRATVGTRAEVTGSAAFDADFTQRLESRTPLVIAFVLGLAFLLLIAAFRSSRLAAAMIGLNLLSVGAAYGVLVAVFQHDWAEDLLGFTSTGTIVNWLPLFAFVILFGLSMDYTILVLERIREARRAGLNARDAAAEGVAATAGTVTSAAVVMVAVFAVFATLRVLDLKQMGVGLGAAVLLDATIVRGVALPAAVALLGERGWKVGRRGAGPRVSSTGRWDHGDPATAEGR